MITEILDERYEDIVAKNLMMSIDIARKDDAIKTLQKTVHDMEVDLASQNMRMLVRQSNAELYHPNEASFRLLTAHPHPIGAIITDGPHRPFRGHQRHQHAPHQIVVKANYSRHLAPFSTSGLSSRFRPRHDEMAALQRFSVLTS
jgi:hypothetical protein